jgi:immune inhibitor A
MRPIVRLVGILLLCLAGGAYSVSPPGTGVEIPAGFSADFTRLNAGYRANLRVGEGFGKGPALASSVPKSIRLPVLLAASIDRQSVIDGSGFESRLFGSYAGGTMAAYYQEASRGHFSLSGDVHGWYDLPQAIAYYTRGGPLGDESLFPESPGGMVAHAVAAADSGVDFGLYDNDGPDGVPNSGDDDGVVDALIVVHTGGDAAAGDNGNIWSHTGRLGANSVATADQSAGGGFIRVDLYSLLPELAGNGSSPVQAEIGVFCHEFGHQLGLVDLYPVGFNSGEETASNGIGAWGLMGFGTRGGDGFSSGRPTHPCAWSKLRLGWVELVHQDSSGPLALAPVQGSGQVVRVWDNDERDLSYFLLANRSRTGFDSGLPAEGLLIWHVDGRAFDNDSAAHKLVDLEEADGLEQLDWGNSTGDSGDPFPGAAGNISFGPATLPSSNRYDGAPSGILLSAIRLEGDEAFFTLEQPTRARITISYDEHGPDPVRGFGYDNNLAHGAVVFTAPVSGIIEAVNTAFIYPGMSYELTVLGGHDNGLLACRVLEQFGNSPGMGWQTIALEQPLFVDAGDSVIFDMAWRASEFDHGWPLPYDRTGESSGRSWVSLYGLGHYASFEHDISLRAVMSPSAQPGAALQLGRSMEFSRPLLELGPTFSGETYRIALPLENTGSRPLDISAPQVTGDGFMLDSYPDRLGCGLIDFVTVGFTPGEPGAYHGQVLLAAPGDTSHVQATLESTVRGWSVRYDSASVPVGLASFTDASHGAVRFDMEQDALMAGVRTYCFRDSMLLRLRLWAGVGGGGGRCLVAETYSDTLLTGRGWHQIFLPLPVAVDSGDTFYADIRYSTPGVSFNELVPIDTTLPVKTASYYNVREHENWVYARNPVAIRALMVSPLNYDGELIAKQPEPQVSEREIVLENARVGVEAVSGLWLINSGTKEMAATATVVQAGDSCVFALVDTAWQISCADSAWLQITCTAMSPGVHTGLIELTVADSLITVQLTAVASSFELGYDENGHTATGGFGDSTATGAVEFVAPWAGVLERARFYVNRAQTRVRAAVYGRVDADGVLADSLASSEDSVFSQAGWYELPLQPQLTFSAGDSFVLTTVFTAPGEYPLPIDHRGEPSGRSFAGSGLIMPLESLNFDLNVRAVLAAGGTEYYPVSGSVRTSAGAAVSGAMIVLSGKRGSYRVATDSTGVFRLKAVAVGNYQFSVLLEGYSVSAPDTLEVNSEITGLALVAHPPGSGDMDGDGRTDIFDLLHLLSVIGGTVEPGGSEDVDSNGRVDIFDLLAILQIIRH